MSIRAKLYAAIVLTILGPLATTAVALQGMSEMDDRFNDGQERAQDEALARELKFAVTDVNGWQTAYGYDNGASRERFVTTARGLRRDLRVAKETLTDPREQQLLSQLEQEFNQFMALDVVAYRDLQTGQADRTREIFLGPEIARFEAMAATAEKLATYEQRRADAADRAFDNARDDARKRLIAVALGAGIVILLLLVTASDVARMALEGERSARGESPRPKREEQPRRDDRP